MTVLLEVDNVNRRFISGGILGRNVTDAVVDARFILEKERPEIFTIIGESGSGKTTLARMILGLDIPTSGTIRFMDKPIPTGMWGKARHEFMAMVQPVFQNPFEAFNPLKRVDRYIESYGSCLPQVRQPDGCRKGDGRGAGQGRPVAGRDQGPLSPRTVRRTAAALRHRAGTGLRSACADRRRAGLDGRCLAAHGHRQPAQVAARRFRRACHLHHPRSCDGLLHLGPHHHHAKRQWWSKWGRRGRCSKTRSTPMPSCSRLRSCRPRMPGMAICSRPTT